MGERIWETAQNILEGEESPAKMIVLGIFLLLTGGSMWGISSAIHADIGVLVGLLLFIGGFVSLFKGIGEYLER